MKSSHPNFEVIVRMGTDLYAELSVEVSFSCDDTGIRPDLMILNYTLYYI